MGTFAGRRTPCFLKIPTIRENFALTSSVRTMSASAVIAGRTSEWSAPVEDLSSWRDEGPIFTYQVEGQWDVMYAPDLVEVKRKDGTKEYYLYPHSRGRDREAMVAKRKPPRRTLYPHQPDC